MRTRPLFRLQALLLLALSGALSTGVPSHHHERPDTGPTLVHADHHGHGTQLVDQGDRQTSEVVVAAAIPTTSTFELPGVEPTASVAPVLAPRPLARGQPPPSERPRAPPVSA